MDRFFALPELHRGSLASARERQLQLTKPRGSLGRLELLAIHLAGLQGHALPSSRPAHAILFASDHPVTAHGVSAYPSEVTRAMVANFVGGGAAASVLSRRLDVSLEIVDVGVAGGAVQVGGSSATYRREAVADLDVGDLVHTDAMSAQVYDAALSAGRDAVDRLGDDVRVLALGEMGIGNTTPAAAVGAALLGVEVAEMVGPGTGLDLAGIERKVSVVTRALARVAATGVDSNRPHEVARALGGREIAALTGAIGRALERRMAVLVDGFIVSAAALVICHTQPEARELLLFAHQSREPGHRRMLEAMKAVPLLSLDMALGEASGALVALPLLDMACALHGQMATFDSAGVPDREPEDTP